MIRFLIFIACLGLGGCIHDQNWARFDGRPTDPQQYAIDVETCRAFAVNAGSQIQAPPPASTIRVTNNATAIAVVQTAPQPAYMNAPMPGAPNIATAGQMNPSVFANAGQNLGAAGRRWRAEDANMRACMAQRGYQAS